MTTPYIEEEWPFPFHEDPFVVVMGSNILKLHLDFIRNPLNREVFEQFDYRYLFNSNDYNLRDHKMYAEILAVNSLEYGYSCVFGSLKEYTKEDCKIFFRLLYFLLDYEPVFELKKNPEKRKGFYRVYRGLLLHTQTIARTFPEYHAYRVPGGLMEAVNMVLEDDGYSDLML